MDERHYIFVAYIVFIAILTFAGWIYYGVRENKRCGYDSGEYGAFGILLLFVAIISMVIMGFALFGDGQESTTITHKYENPPSHVTNDD